jgi:hypothetical protein
MESYVLDTLQCGPVTHYVEIKSNSILPEDEIGAIFLNIVFCLKFQV